ncbi:putative transcriptional regulator [Candidatus Methanophagaceae archaeon]|nr:putative transcriptional regulator [Methanophagales archaeon]
MKRPNYHGTGSASLRTGELIRSAKRRTRTMSSVKARMAEIIQEQPEDATYEEIMRELAFERMVERGLADSRTGRVISNEEMARLIRTWQK